MVVWLLAFAIFGCVNAATIGGGSYDTIVVGLGASGTAAASTLARAGKNVLALEAQSRIGGRIHTVPFGDGVVEIGAEWIHGEVNSSVLELAVRNNVTILPDILTASAYRSDGSQMDIKLVEELVGVVLECGQDPPEKPELLGSYTTRRLMKYILDKHPEITQDQDFVSELFAYLDLIVNTYQGTTNWNDVSTASKGEDLEGNQSMSWHRNGYKTMFDILLNTYRNGTGLPSLEYKLNTPVSKIRMPEDPSGKVVVTCVDGSTFKADNVIVTASVGVLKERYDTLFSSPLPKEKVDAIKNIKIGLESKIVLLFPNRWWGNSQFIELIWRGIDKREVKKEDLWLTKIPEVSHPMGVSNVLTLWITGDYAMKMEMLSDEVVKNKCMELLTRFLGANLTIPEPINMIRTSWFSNPYTRGSFTYDDADYPLHSTARSDLAQPIRDADGNPRILFAGEATNDAHYASVHGAVDSGYREARRLLDNKA